jgi:hypothetical protein
MAANMNDHSRLRHEDNRSRLRHDVAARQFGQRLAPT